MSASNHARSTWWRRQRVALLLLPFIVVAALAASSMNVKEYWWNRGFHDAAPTAADGSVTLTDEYDDGYQSYPIRATVRLEGAAPVTELPGAFRPLQLPDGTALWELRLGWAADPDTVLAGCSVALHDADGSLYEAGNLAFDAGAPLPVQKCLPDDTPGPNITVGVVAPPKLGAGQSPRPPTWSTRVYVLAPEDANPESVRVWWYLPTYAELPLD